MATVNFTPTEIENIKRLQEQYNVLGIQLVQLRLAQKNATAYLESLKEQEQILDEQITAVNAEEKQLAKSLDSKYGEGSLDLETGEFTSKQ